LGNRQTVKKAPVAATSLPCSYKRGRDAAATKLFDDIVGKQQNGKQNQKQKDAGRD
jgi:hypothetical protein